ncbi:uncharacterized protein LOC131248906 [Magnolia sinica]|uniref:uncharacterized protein LOC131248906 n=1 Tax=Magnolia sinica TaxID=86752 RepID=UPI0026592F55|nr:uncharacterized protein LOC131248906 [Magnolia sinica]
MDEVLCVMKTIPGDGAPSLDDFSWGFFSTYWEVVGPNLLKSARFLFQGGKFPRAATTSLICLIPKFSSPTRLSDYHPTNLCNCLYKILTGVITARLSQVLPSIISPKQGAFIQGRPILESIALAQEHFRDINRKARGGNLILKLDMEKAYDRVE